MRLIILAATLAALAGCASDDHAAPAGSGSIAPSGAGAQPGASAGAAVGGGPAGTGTTDSAGGAK